jgi:hypothetical protein
MRAKVVKKKIARAKRRTKPSTKARPAPRRTKPKAKPRIVAKKKISRPTRAAEAALLARVAADREMIATLESEVRRLRSARRRLEQRLTAAVQEIGSLRQWELRAQMFENEVAKRDREISRLHAELADRLGGASIVSAPA